MHILLKWLLNAIAIIFSAYLISGVGIGSFWAALWVALFLGLVNVTLKPILVILTLPINILTLGLFTFIINAALIMLASSVVKGFTVSGFWPAILFGIVLSVISFLLNKILNPK